MSSMSTTSSLQDSRAVTGTDARSSTIESIPQAEQTVSHEGKVYTTIKEGLAHILVPSGTPTSTDPKMSKEDTQRQQVFYNPIQQFNRDLSVLAIKTFGEDVIHRRQQKHEEALRKGRKAKERKQKTQTEPLVEESQASVAPTESTSEGVQMQTVAKGALQTMSETTEAISRKRKFVSETGGEGQVEASESDVKRGKFINGDATGQERTITNEDTTTAPRDYRPEFKILDALSATGLRALRYAKEIPFTTSITANDRDKKATESIALNVKHNKLDHKIKAHEGNAIALMYQCVDRKGYDVVDLDPYGTAAPFLDAAVQALNDDGLLCVTCTDSAIFASHGYLEKTYSQYGGLPLIGNACHEGGIRLILNAVAQSAARYGRAIEPLLSLSIDYYVRTFVRVRKSANDVKLLAGKTMIVYTCDSGCGAWSTQYLARHKTVQNRNGNAFYKHSFAQAPSTGEHCEHCGSKRHLAGPMYGGPLHSVDFIEHVLAQLEEADRDTYQTTDRIKGMLHTALEEMTFGPQTPSSHAAQETKRLDPLIAKADPAEREHHPFFFIPSALARVLHCQAPSLAAMRGALRRAGYRVTMSHCKPGSIRTDAPWKAIWHVMLEWVRQKAPLRNKPPKGSPGYTILSRATAHKEEDFKDDAPLNGVDATIEKSPSHLEQEPRSGGEAESLRSPEAKTAEQSAESRPSYLDVDFEVILDEQLGKDLDRGKYVRFQLAPRENWGPMSRAK